MPTAELPEGASMARLEDYTLG